MLINESFKFLFCFVVWLPIINYSIKLIVGTISVAKVMGIAFNYIHLSMQKSLAVYK